MKLKSKSTLLLRTFACILAFCWMTASAKMYKWIDKDGKPHYSQTLPPAQQSQQLNEFTITNKQKKGNKNCCLVIRKISDKMILAQHKGATITDLYSLNHPQLGDLTEIANYVAHKFDIGITPSQISQMTFDTCLNGGFNLCTKGEDPTLGDSSGSGFYINADGYLLTNHHVVKKCNTIRVLPSEQEAQLITSNANIDLAILKTQPSADYAHFRKSKVNLGEEILVAGFPYRGELSSGMNVTTGIVSALAGPKDDQRLIQITAPVQPGNSGGPLLDQYGQVTGIVTSKLNSLYFAEKYNDIPQNINFAIRASYILAFLREHDILANTNSVSYQAATTNISAQAGNYTVVVECIK